MKHKKKILAISSLAASSILLCSIILIHNSKPVTSYSIHTTKAGTLEYNEPTRCSFLPPFLELSPAAVETEAPTETPAPTPEATIAPTPTPEPEQTQAPTNTPAPTKARAKKATAAPVVETAKPEPEAPQAATTTEVQTNETVNQAPASVTTPGISYGIDVSKWQGNINWSKVKNAGKEFAFIKFGGRDVSDLAFLYIDEYFSYNISQASANGLRVGIYFFSQAITVDEAVEEANFLAANISGYHLDYPVVYDWEFRANTRGTNANLSTDEHIAIAHAFVDTLKSHGYDTMMYGSISSPTVQAILPTLSDCKLWLARYTNDPNVKPAYSGKYQIWQYSNTGRVDGIGGNVDLDVEIK